MLNYIWTGLIVASLGFALYYDVGDELTDKYRNGQSFPVAVTPLPDADINATAFPATAAIDPGVYAEHYGLAEPPELPGSFSVTLTKLSTEPGYEIKFNQIDKLPPRLLAVAEAPDPKKPALVATVAHETWTPATTVAAELTGLAPVRFTKIKAITKAAFDMAEVAVISIAFPLIGLLALWLGMVKIAEAGGLVNILVKIIQPVLHPLFPDLPRDHPAIGMIALNLAANVLGLGNAATPMGIKAMEEMQKLNPEKDTATNSMCTFLAINTASVQLLPPATLIAVMGVATGKLWLPILLVTGASLIVGIVAVRLLQRLPAFTKTDPNRHERDNQQQDPPDPPGPSGPPGGPGTDSTDPSHGLTDPDVFLADGSPPRTNGGDA